MSEITDLLVHREMKMESGEVRKFPFLVVDSPEKWEVANKIKGFYDLPMGDTSRRINVRCISLREWDKMSAEVPYKTPVDADNKTDDEKAYEAQVELHRKVLALEVCTGMTIPGATLSDKGEWLTKRTKGEVQSVGFFITNEAGCFANGSLLQLYQRSTALSTGNPQTMESFEDWDVASSTQYSFRFQRPFQDYIVEIPLKGISTEQSVMIDKEHPDPQPPMEPFVDPTTQRIVPNKMVPNRNDPSFMAKLRAVAEKRTLLVFKAVLTFDIPGTSYREQYDWLSERSAGEMVKLSRYIDQEITNYGSRYDFFSRSLGLNY